jgi:hypothetical protein
MFIPIVFAEEPTPKQLDFATQYIEAIRSKDRSELNSLYHSKAFDCVNSGNKHVIEHMIKMELDREIPEEYKLQVYPQNPEAEPERMRNMYKPTIETTHQLQIHYSNSLGSTTILNIPIVEEDGNWRIVLLCPTEAGLKWFDEKSR